MSPPTSSPASAQTSHVSPSSSLTSVPRCFSTTTSPIRQAVLCGVPLISPSATSSAATPDFRWPTPSCSSAN